MFSVSKGLSRAMAMAAALCVSVGVAFGAAPQAQAVVGSGYVYASPTLNMRTDASSTAGVIAAIPYRTQLTISCVKNGSPVSNSYGTSTLWDYVYYNGRWGFVSDQWVWTGTSAPTAPYCSSPTPPPSSGRAVGAKRSWNAGAVGNCTWGAYYQWWRATGYYPALWGNAKDWAGSARATGWTVVYDAQPRSIVVFQPRVWGANATYGHVGWVTSVQRRADGLYVTFIEMNALAGFNRWNYRTVKDVPGMQYILAP